MKLKEYFSQKQGRGVMATGNAAGIIDTAVYSRPHVMEDNTIAFIMRDRLTHKNLQETSHANYLFMEKGDGYSGVRLFMTKIDETDDHDLIASLTRRHLSPEEDKAKGKKFLVRFNVDRVLTLIGGKEIDWS